MIYLIDANVLITAHRNYYPLEAIPEFWTWLLFQGAAGRIKMPVETYEEVKDGSTDAQADGLYGWIQASETKDSLLWNEQVDIDAVARVLEEGYGLPLPNELDLEEVGQDPFLIAHALSDPQGRTVVTTEVSAPKKQGANRRIPDVCKTLDLVYSHFRHVKDPWV